jgi:outer membrane protein TolC
LVFDERVWAGLSIEKSLQSSREFDRDALRLDVMREAGVAYLNVLRAKTFERIQRDNLDVTATNLDFARLRVSAGAANLSEVYRWQVQLSTSQQAVVDSEVLRALNELDVNRILYRPLEESFDTEETSLTDPPISDLLELIQPYIDNPRDFEVFRGFVTEEALEASPEIDQLDALTDAQERARESSTRSFFLPQIALEAGLDNRFSESGAGSDELAGFDRLTWNAALVFSYPLFTGIARFAAESQASEELARLQIQRDEVSQRIDQRVRSALHLLRGSWVKIELTRAAATAAANNFRLVQDAYRRGVGGILGLLDAQNEALVADEGAADAVYDFLIDLVEVERSVGRFEYFRSAEARAVLFDRLDQFYRQSSVRPGDVP